MFRPLSLYLGLRYTRAKRRNHFISFIALVSMLGIALGVTVLITVLSVMNGFDEEIRTRIFEMAPQISIRNFEGHIDDWKTLQIKASKFSGVLGVAPFVEGQGMLSEDDNVRPVLVSGIEPTQENKVSVIAKKMLQGGLENLKPGYFGMILGEELATGLGLRMGDKVTLFVPETTVNIEGVMPQFKRFTVVGIFKAGAGFGFDSQLALINLNDAQKLFQLHNAVTGLRLKVMDLYRAPFMAHQIAQTLTEDFFVNDWTLQYGPLFKAIKLEKTMMFFILLLIVAVAVFNLVSSLVMMVNDKRADIAILRTFGATPTTIMATFIIQGFIIGATGTVLGVIGGILLALNVTHVVSFIQNVFHVQFLSSAVYYVDYLPSKLQFSDVSQICLAAFLLSLVATVYPAWRAARTRPAEALRYE